MFLYRHTNMSTRKRWGWSWYDSNWKQMALPRNCRSRNTYFLFLMFLPCEETSCSIIVPATLCLSLPLGEHRCPLLLQGWRQPVTVWANLTWGFRGRRHACHGWSYNPSTWVVTFSPSSFALVFLLFPSSKPQALYVWGLWVSPNLQTRCLWRLWGKVSCLHVAPSQERGGWGSDCLLSRGDGGRLRVSFTGMWETSWVVNSCPVSTDKYIINTLASLINNTKDCDQKIFSPNLKIHANKQNKPK